MPSTRSWWTTPLAWWSQHRHARDGCPGRTRAHRVDTVGDIAYTVSNPGDSLTLQITSSALPYTDLLGWGFINIGDLKLDVPTVA